MSVCTESAYRTSLRMPATVNEFFAALAEYGTIVGVNDSPRGGVTLYLTAADQADAEQQTRRLGQRLGEAGIAPAFPTTHVGGDWARIASYRWEFDTPIYAGSGQWAVLVPITSDLLHLLGVVSGLGGWDRDYRGQPVLPVTLYSYDDEDLLDPVREIESELEAWFGEPVRLSPPALIV